MEFYIMLKIMKNVSILFEKKYCNEGDRCGYIYFFI